MTRYSTNEPDVDRYEPKPLEDVDVPDFDAPEPAIDPAEHASHSLIDALAMLSQEIVLASSLARLQALKEKTKRALQHADRVDFACSDAIDVLLERLR